MAKRRKLDLSSNFIEEGDSTGLSKIPPLVGFPIDRRVKSQKRQHSPETNRSRYHSDNVTDTLSQIGRGVDSSNVLRLQLHDLLEKAHCKAQSRMTKAQDAVQELRRIIEQIPPRDRISVRVELDFSSDVG